MFVQHVYCNIVSTLIQCNHRVKERPETKGANTMSTNEISAKVIELKELQQLIEEATAQADSIKDELKAHMTAQGADEMTVGVFKLRYKAVTSSRFDSTAFKAKYGDLYAAYIKPTTSMRFSVA